MNSQRRIAVVLESFEAKLSLAALAAREGVSVEELEAWRATWLAGARASAGLGVPRRRVWLGLAVVGLVTLASHEALSANCVTPSFFSSLGLKYFCADDPALASDVNQNTQQLVNLIQQKIGANWGLADAGVATTGISTPTVSTTTATVSGTANFGTSVRQMINLFDTSYGIGVQNNTEYFRTAKNFAWYLNGTHNSAELNPGGGTTLMTLGPTGIVSAAGFNTTVANGFTSSGIKQNDSAATSTYGIELGRLMVEARTAGALIPINQTALGSLCGDDDGCQYTLSMVNFANNDGVAATRSGTLFLSQAGPGWRLEQGGVDVVGIDGNGGLNEVSVFDCYFTDTDVGPQNSRTDTTTGFSLFNCAGCAYPDSPTFCRMVFRD